MATLANATVRMLGLALILSVVFSYAQEPAPEPAAEAAPKEEAKEEKADPEAPRKSLIQEQRQILKDIRAREKELRKNDPEVADKLPMLLGVLGDPTPEKKWLAASLAKTIRLQLDPPDELRVLSALSGPNWIKQIGGE